MSRSLGHDSANSPLSGDCQAFSSIFQDGILRNPGHLVPSMATKKSYPEIPALETLCLVAL